MSSTLSIITTQGNDFQTPGTEENDIQDIAIEIKENDYILLLIILFIAIPTLIIVYRVLKYGYKFIKVCKYFYQSALTILFNFYFIFD
jgi:hypothetical protein